MIVLVDYGMGNRRSVEKAFEHVGVPTRLSDDADEIARADALVLPGVGAFPKAMAELEARGLRAPLVERAAAGVPVLGICLGMQLLFERSRELGGADGLGLLKGSVEPLDAPRLPHIGWNEVRWERATPLTEGLPDPTAFYHVHSFAVRADDADVVGRGDYGGPFVSVVARENLFGVQFHPEKSSAHGLRLLRNFAALVARVPA